VEQLEFPVSHLYIMMGTNVRANEPDNYFKLKMLVASKLGKFRQIVLVSDR
jgi:hypothetical protein